jgi:hypothetical protein
MINNNNNFRFSGSSSVPVFNPFGITGFIDAEGCFHIGINKHNRYKQGYSVEAVFKIHLHQKDLALLKMIQNYFGVGNIYVLAKGSIQYQVSSVKELGVILDHFEKYPLITQKLADYLLFKQAFELINRKEHLTPEGLRKLVAIKASMNKGLSPQFKAAFADVEPVTRLFIQDQIIPDPYWLAGFTEGEGCFLVNTQNSSTHRLGCKVELRFQITQHSRDTELMKSLVEYLGCGKIFESRDAVDFVVTKLPDLISQIIPFFDKYPLQGVKSKEFLDFKIVAKLMQNKEHLTQEGLEQIRQIKSGMNTQRK